MNNKKIWLAAAAIAAAVAAGAAAQAVQLAKPYQQVSITANLSTKKDPKIPSFLTWSADRDKNAAAAKDTYAAATGASALGSTKKFFAVYGGIGTVGSLPKTMPAGVCGLILYSVGNSRMLDDDGFAVIEKDAKAKDYIIRFIHRGTAYELTVKKGLLDLDTGARLLAGVAAVVGGEYTLKPEFLTAGEPNTEMSSANWDEISPQMVADAADHPTIKYASKKFQVTYTAATGLLTVRGQLTPKK